MKQQLFPDRALIVPTPALHPPPKPTTAACSRETGKRFPSAPSLTSFSVLLPALLPAKEKCSYEDEYGLTPCGFLLWVVIICPHASPQWAHQLSVTLPEPVFQPFKWNKEWRSSVVVRGCCLSPPAAATCIRRKKSNTCIFFIFFFLLFLPWSQAYKGGQRIIKSYWASRLGTKPRRTLKYWKAL